MLAGYVTSADPFARMLGTMMPHTILLLKAGVCIRADTNRATRSR